MSVLDNKNFQKTKNSIWFLFFIIFFCAFACSKVNFFEGYVITDKGAWCWFADPRALHYKNESGSINSAYIGYIDVHGNVKATQHDFLSGKTYETLIRSCFQPDDHNNPTFLILPDERVMVFYTRHTDEACFYYRVSQKPGDITTLGEEKRLVTTHNTTYPSPFILANDPKHIYLCWRGINWHPTIARLTMPDVNDDVSFNWGPFQKIQSTAARPYAKYTSNGIDKIYMAYVMGHPDNENPNWMYFNFINIPGADASKITLTDVNDKFLSTVADETHNVNTQETYIEANKYAVVNSDAVRNWIWQTSIDAHGAPVIAMVQINDDKTSHDYYHVKWTGDKWQKTFLANGGGHFHQTPEIELCYSGGMAIDDANTDIVYCSVPIEGINGKFYEIVRYTINAKNGNVSSKLITKNSQKNNIRPYIIANSGGSPLRLAWMHGDYYDWIVSSRFPLGFPTAIHTDFVIPRSENIPKPVDINKLNITGDFSVLLSFTMNSEQYDGTIAQIGNVTYGINGDTMKPYIRVNDATYQSSNRIGNSDVWQMQRRATSGRWYEPTIPDVINFSFVYENGRLKTFIDGLLDQNIEVPNLSFRDFKTGDFGGEMKNSKIYNAAVSQHIIKILINQ